MSRNNSSHVTVTGSVTSEFMDFRGQVLEDGCQLDYSPGLTIFALMTREQQNFNFNNTLSQFLIQSTALTDKVYTLLHILSYLN